MTNLDPILNWAKAKENQGQTTSVPAVEENVHSGGVVLSIASTFSFERLFKSYMRRSERRCKSVPVLQRLLPLIAEVPEHSEIYQNLELWEIKVRMFDSI